MRSGRGGRKLNEISEGLTPAEGKHPASYVQDLRDGNSTGTGEVHLGWGEQKKN